jgi:DNA-binding beta-propeller fold protein YncE
MTSIIDVGTDTVVDVFGNDEPVVPFDYGGSLATGHPLWVNNERFFMLDRAGRQIQLWSRNHGLISVLDTPTSVHHIFQSPLDDSMHVYYAVAEGNRSQPRSPSILRFGIHRGIITMTGEALLADYDGALNPAEMGSHHADFHPDGVHIYVGSAEGHVFVVNKDSMEIVTMIDSGLGSGHTTFAPLANRAFVTNHNDTFMTVINTLDHTWVADIVVASEASSEYKSQAHTSSVSPDGAYFYSAASHDGVFFEIDIATLEVSDTVFVGEGANILMGSFIWDGDSDNGGM